MRLKVQEGYFKLRINDNLIPVLIKDLRNIKSHIFLGSSGPQVTTKS